MGTAFSALVSPSPLRGEVKVGVSRPLQAQNLPLARHPHPSFPIMGELPFSGRGTMLPQERRPTSSLMGEAGRGWSHSHKSIHLIPVPKTCRILHPIFRDTAALQRPVAGRCREGTSLSASGSSNGRLGRETPVRESGTVPKTGNPGTVSVSYFYLLRGERRLGVRPLLPGDPLDRPAADAG